jgi:hypothetical protein
MDRNGGSRKYGAVDYLLVLDVLLFDVWLCFLCLRCFFAVIVGFAAVFDAAGAAGFELLLDEASAKTAVPPRSRAVSESDATIFFIKLSSSSK